MNPVYNRYEVNHQSYGVITVRATAVSFQRDFVVFHGDTINETLVAYRSDLVRSVKKL